jgi:hypothetical protein
MAHDLRRFQAACLEHVCCMLQFLHFPKFRSNPQGWSRYQTLSCQLHRSSPPSYIPIPPPLCSHYQSTLDALCVYVVPWSEIPIVLSYPHICIAMVGVPPLHIRSTAPAECGLSLRYLIRKRGHLPATGGPRKPLRGGIPGSFLEPLVRSWSHFVGIYRQKLTRSLKN